MSELVRRWGEDGWAIDDPKDGTEACVAVYPVESIGLTAMIQCPAGSEEDTDDIYGRVIGYLCERIEKLEACVKAADCLVGRDWPEYETRHRYEIARAALGEVEREG